MEWVETTGRSVEEAKEAALDQLGVDETDAEFEIVEEPRFGLFGRLRSEARVRARVRPTKPRAKEERRERRGRRKPGSGGTADTAHETDTRAAAPAPAPAPAAAPAAAGRAAAAVAPTGDEPTLTGTESGPVRRNRRGQGGGGGSRGPDRERRPEPRPRQSSNDDETSPGGGMEVALDEQGAVAKEFLEGLVERMNLEAKVAMAQPEEDTVELNLEGPDLGLLIGPKGATLLAVQDLTRTVVQRKTSAANGRILVDVGGYRRKRKEALGRFARQVAAEVVASGSRRVLEPMSAADRKVVHDTVNDIDGVMTTSEGEEPLRRVVILPVAGASGRADEVSETEPASADDALDAGEEQVAAAEPAEPAYQVEAGDGGNG